MKITRTPSPNFNARKTPVDMLVLHYTGMQSGDAALERMCDPEAGVSAHYMVRETGETLLLVEEEMRAWHAGVSRWQGNEDLNSHSIGIEIVNGGHDWRLPGGALPPYPDAQIDTVIELAKTIIERWQIPQTRIVAHSDIAPARKQDPGEHFPWARLAWQGVGLWPKGRGRPDSDLASSLRTIGYDLLDETAAISAFQRRWRAEKVDGQADPGTVSNADAVAQLYSGG